MNKYLNRSENCVVMLTKEDQIDQVQYINELIDILKPLSKEDWKTILEISKSHRVCTCVYINIKRMEKCGVCIGIPEDIRNQFQQELDNAMKNERKIEDERKRLAKLFVDNGMKVVFLKGLSYKKYIYKMDGYRISKDLDILVPEENLIDVHEILLRNGYKDRNNDSNDITPIETIKKSFMINAYGVMDYYNADNVIMLDMHKITRYNIYNSKDLYENAVKDENDIYELNYYDLFIYTCHHAYHHYGIDSSYVNKSNISKLKLLMDIRSYMIRMGTQISIQEITDRIIKINAQYVVNEMVKLTELIYDEEYPVIKGVTDSESLMNHTSIQRGFYSRFEHRLFRPIEERNRILEYLADCKNEMKEQDTDESYFECKQERMSEWKDESFWDRHKWYKSSKDKIWFGIANIYGSTTILNNGRYCELSFAWDEHYLYTNWRMYDSVVIFGDRNYFEIKQNQLVLSIETLKTVKSIYIQPKENGEDKIFVTNDGIMNSREAVDYSIITNRRESYYETIFKLSWCEIQIDPNPEQKIGLYVNVWVGDEKNEDTYNLSYYDQNKRYLALKDYSQQ